MIGYRLQYSWTSLVAQLVKNLPAIKKTLVGSLEWEDPLEKEKATHSSILAWRIPGLYRPRGCKESDTTERLSLSLKQKRQRTETSGLYLQPLALCPHGLLAYCSYLSLSLQTEPGKEQRLHLHPCLLWAFPAVSLY